MSLKTYFQQKRLNRLESDLKMLNSQKYNYDNYGTLFQKLVDSSFDEKLLLENMAWLSGNAEIIYQYHTQIDKNTSKVNIKKTRFWSTAPAILRHVHSGIPSVISETFAKVLFNQGFKVNVNIMKKDNVKLKDDRASEDATVIIYDFIDTLKLEEKLTQMAKICSGMGDCCLKYSFDFSLSPYIIIEVVPRTLYKVNKIRGITKSIEFYTWITKEDPSKRSIQLVYKLVEIYSKDESGNATIESKLYIKKKNTDSEFSEVNLKSIPETQDIEPYRVFAGVKGILADQYSNIKNSNVFYQTPYGDSDYNNSHEEFDSLDNCLSELVSQLTDTKPMREFPEDLFQTYSDGAIEDSQTFKQFNKYITNFIKTRRSNKEGDNGKITVTEFPDRTDMLINTYLKLLSLICAGCKISPISLGLQDMLSLDSSDKSTREKSKATTETRKQKLKLIIPVMKETLRKVLQFQQYLCSIDGYPLFADEFNAKEKLKEIDTSNLNLDITFNDYIVDSVDSKVTTWGTAKSTRVASTRVAVENIYSELSKDAQDEIVKEIKLEEGMALDSPDALLLSDSVDNEFSKFKVKQDEKNITEKTEEDKNNPKVS